MSKPPVFGLQFMQDENIAWQEIEPGIRRKVFSYDERVMMVKVAFEQDRVGTLHHHPHTQISYVAAGTFEISIGAQKQVLRAGDGFYIPPNAVHGALCLEAGVLVDVFSPIREDFLPED